MPIESAREFWKKVNEDKEFQKRFETANDNEERVKMIRDGGYEFTKEEMKQAVQEVTGRELTDEELDNVSGGMIPMIICLTSIFVIGTGMGFGLGFGAAGGFDKK